MLAVEVVLRAQHYLQACAHMSILLYWGWYWREVYHAVPLFAAQLAFAYAFDALLVWSRRDTYTLGFGPFPIIFSTNLFLWFKPDWFYLQFVMVAVGFAAKELIRWNKEGRMTHIFNPSSFTLTVFSVFLLLTGTTGMTWGPDIAISQFNPPHIFLLIFLVTLPAQFLFGVAPMTLGAVTTTYAFCLAFYAATGTNYFLELPIPIAVFLGMHLLFTDPSTAPRTELGRLMFGVLYGLSVIALIAVLKALDLPTFYDKLLPIPILNLMIRAIDRAARSNLLKRFDPGAVGRSLRPRQRNLAYMGVWAVVFTIMQVQTGAQATLVRGDMLTEQGRIDEAITRYREFIQSDPADPIGYHQLGAALMQTGRFEEAIPPLQHTIELHPNNPKAHNNLGVALMQIGRSDDAVKTLQQAIELQPNSSNAHNNLGILFLRARRFEDAVVSLRKAVELEPTSADAHANLGQALMQTGRFEDAVFSLRRAAELQPSNAEAYDNLGLALARIGRFDEAVASLERAVELEPNRPEANRNLGLAFLEAGRFADAIASLQRAAALEPGSPEVHHNLAVASMRMGRPDAAIASFQRVVELQPNSPEANGNLGLALLQAGRFADAGVSLQRAAALEPGSPEVQHNLAVASMRMGRPDAAIASLQRVVELQPNSPEAHHNLGQALMQVGRFADAVAPFQRALKLKPDYPEGRFNLAQALSAIGQWTAAVAQLREALRVRPDWPAALTALAEVEATAPEAALRNPANAVRLASRAADLTGRKDARILDVLAAAYAASGRFAEAIRTAETAEALASGSAPDLAAQIRARLNLYRAQIR